VREYEVFVRKNQRWIEPGAIFVGRYRDAVGFAVKRGLEAGGEAIRLRVDGRVAAEAVRQEDGSRNGPGNWRWVKGGWNWSE
jgi:hypothetical protein